MKEKVKINNYQNLHIHIHTIHFEKTNFCYIYLYEGRGGYSKLFFAVLYSI